MHESVARHYEALTEAGTIVSDPVQRVLIVSLDGLNQAIHERSQASQKRGLARLFSRRSEPPPLHGLYIWGGVGRGKTLLMDIFFDVAPTERKRRAHFHEFMADVHDRIAAFRRKLKAGEVRGDDPIAPVANDIASEIELLCFDEFAVYDIADAMILSRLFEQLFRRGVIVVATTNVEPDNLYRDGLNRALFLPFIALLKKHMSIFHLDAPRDYRLGNEETGERYVVPLGPQADAYLDTHFRSLTGVDRGSPMELSVKGRRIEIPEAAEGVARFKFDDLCSRPLGASDFLRIAERFHTIILADVPILSAARRNEAKRLINLVDTIYDQRVRLIVSAEAEADQLWQGRQGAETFEFERTASRLIEIRSDSYWQDASAAHKREARAF